MNRTTRSWLLAGILLLALGLRVVNIGAEPYWNDEILSLDIVRQFDTATMVRYVSEVEFHPPLYYLMLKGWIGMFGAEEAATRALSLVFSLGTVVLAWVAGRRFFKNDRVAAAAALLMAVLPLSVEYGQEARPYAIFTFFGIAAALCLWERLRGGSRAWLAGYILFSAIGLYLHYSFIFFLCGMGLWWFIEVVSSKRSEKGRVLVELTVAHAGIFLLFFPWLDSLFYKIVIGRHDLPGLASEIPSVRRPEFFERLFHHLIWPNRTLIASKVEVFTAFAAKLALLGGLILAVMKGVKGKWRRTAAFLAVLIIVPVTGFLFSPQSVGYTDMHVRHVLPVLIPAALIIAWTVSRLSLKRAAGIIVLLLVSLVPSLALVLDNDAKWDRHFRYEDAGAYLTEQYREDDLLIIAAVSMRPSIAHYLPERMPIASYKPLSYYGNDEWATRHTLGMVENESQVRNIEISNSLRAQSVEKAERKEKIEKLEKLLMSHGPDRVWLYSISPADPAHAWFEERGWRHAIRSMTELSRIDLYVAP